MTSENSSSAGFAFPAVLAMLIGGINTLWQRKPVFRFDEKYFEFKPAPLASRRLVAYSEVRATKVEKHRAIFYLQNEKQVKVALSIIDKSKRATFERLVSSFNNAPGEVPVESYTEPEQADTSRPNIAQLCKMPLSWHGSISRRYYVLCGVVAFMLLTVVTVLLSLVSFFVLESTQSDSAAVFLVLVTSILGILAAICYTYLVANLAAQRFRNIGWPPLIPIAILWPLQLIAAAITVILLVGPFLNSGFYSHSSYVREEDWMMVFQWVNTGISLIIFILCSAVPGRQKTLIATQY
ncbi:hypothetical protein [Salinibius halmophilus]|uniref:hypothetical protein n=1 Tax=Salinibius halmophilus TaxID=1853216 RepID=UPI001313F532|nr:hypothetical protein [Salinibius halmophilus]